MAEAIIFILVFGVVIIRLIAGARQQNMRQANRQGQDPQAGTQWSGTQQTVPQRSGSSPRPITTSGSYKAPAPAQASHSRGQKHSTRQQPPRGVPARKTQTGPNEILERAKANTSDVHRSHSVREAEAEARRSASQVQQPQTEFGSASFGSAVSGLDSIQTPEQRKARLQEELHSERNDQNSQSGRNRIMESAKENALQTQLDNLTDGERDLMKELRDLMVTGPQYELPYTRDFVAEGMELLNSYYEVKGF